MSDYVTQMRKLIGSRPLLQCGSTVIIIDQNGRIRVDPAEGKEARFFAIGDIPAAISPPIRRVIEDFRRRRPDATGAETVDTRPLFQKVDCLQLPVPDLAAALEFYRDKLGHSLVWRTEQAAGLRLSGSEAELVLRTDPRPPETDLTVASADDAAARFVAAGGTVVAGPFGIRIGRCVVVADPWGNQLVLLDETKGLLQTDAAGNVISS